MSATTVEERNPMESKFLSYEQAAKYLSIPIGTLRQMVHYKRIPHVRIGPRSVKFDREALDRWIDEHRVANDQAR